MTAIIFHTREKCAHPPLRLRLTPERFAFKQLQRASLKERWLNGSELISKLVTGVIFVDGEELQEQAA